MRTYLPPPTGFDARAFAREAARAIGLPLPDEALDDVTLNLERTAGFAELLVSVPGLDGEEPAPVFRPERGRS
ncbi:MAG: DUF4089 domain-containing protein [Rhodobacter sp.]|nr:DUF4089 domain-containing protein [Rhodobacter sp.]MCY4168675.1 DUF4089 domain-containing protein [Rhodobacter sp.]MCY4241743.1 DUF4089 domain-containing protein [Rhodobacter sp.]